MAAKAALTTYLANSLRLRLSDGRTIVGVLECVDGAGNLILSHAEEWTLAPVGAAEEAGEAGHAGGGGAAAAAATAHPGEEGGEGVPAGGSGVGGEGRRRQRVCRRIGLVLAPASHVRRVAVRAHVAAAGGVRELPSGCGVL